MTQYDKCVDSAMEVYRQEERDRKAAERLEQIHDGHKAAARIWYNLMEEFWPPVFDEAYFEKVGIKFNDVWNENKDNQLLHDLLVMGYQYLGDVAEEIKKVKSGK